MDLVEARKECVSKPGRRQVLPKNLREAANRKCRRRTVGRQHVNDGVLTIDQSKTEGGEEAHLEIPLHPKLKEIIDATHFGKAYTAPGFGNWFREMCNAADCLDVSAHGLRKATARRLAEIGCSANQIASISGHASLSEVQRYTKAADRKRMAREAMTKLVEGGW